MKIRKRLRCLVICSVALLLIGSVAALVRFDLSGDGQINAWDLQLGVSQNLPEKDQSAILDAILGGGDELHKNEQGQWEIYSSLGLYNMAQNAHSGDTFLLMQNIDMGGQLWTPIQGFTGTFIQGNHSISNMSAALFADNQITSATMTRESHNGLNYWLYTPENPTENMPLIVYLHGGSGKGEDLNLITDVEGFPQFVKEDQISCQAYMIFPQCPSTQKGWNTMANGVADLIQYTCQTYKLDSSKVSLTGHSMGGTGTWSIALAKPNLFYKIAPTSGSVKMTDVNLAALSSIPVWAVVGSADTIVDPQGSIDMIAALQDIGGDATITVLDGVDHFGVPAIAYLDTELVQWLVS